LTLSGLIFGKPVKFIIDSGAEKSVFPHSLVPEAICYPTSIQLSSVDNNPLQTFGHFTAVVAVPSLRRQFQVHFIATNTKPILGADFLTSYGLTLDMRMKKICDPLTSLSAELSPVQGDRDVIRVTKSQDESTFLKDCFPKLLTAPDYSFLPPDFQTVHSIDTTGNPIFSKPRPLPPDKFQIAKTEFDHLLNLKIIRPSNSPWSSPLHMVRKADGSWRPCGDYRRLNAVTTPDRYSIPNMNTIHHKLKGATTFSKLDLVKAYHFIPMDPKDIPKTAICTPFGNFEYLRMPFGLRNSTSTFQRFIDDVFRDFPFVVTYIDDILVFSSSEEEHREHLSRVCTQLNSVGLKLNEKKSALCRDSVPFLGYEINSKGIKPLPERVEVLRNLPEPTDSKVLQRYLGMFGFYQKCIPNFSERAKPLRDLIKNPNFLWSEEHTIAFNDLKQCVSTATELAFPVPNAPLTLTADASAHAIGACLHQVVDGESSPLSFFSRQLSNVESRYSTFDRELLAIFVAIKKWRHLVSGSALTIFTDHKPLVGAIRNAKDRPSGRQERQISFILEYTTDIVHISGKENIVADTLSRTINHIETNNTSHANIQTNSDDNSNLPFVDLFEIAKQQANCDFDFSKYKKYDLGNQSLFCEISRPNPRPFIPSNLRSSIFASFHCLSHPGWKATCRLVGSRYYWPTMRSDIKLWCSHCQPCQSSKISRHVKRPFGDLPCPTRRFSTVHIDIVGPLESSSLTLYQPRYLVTMIDSHTRWLEAIPVTEITAHTICKCFVFHWVARFGPPLTIVTDKGSQFCCELMSNLNELLGIHHIRTSSYNPKANGLVERSHRSLKASLIARGKDWIEQLPFVLLGMRTYPDEDGSSPYSRVTGEQPVMPKLMTEEFDISKLNAAEFKYKMPRSRSRSEHLPEELGTCKHVWLRLDRVKRPLEAPYQGPFEVTDRTNSTFTILVRGKPTTVSIERVKPARIFKALQQPTVILEETPLPTQMEEQLLPDRTRSGRRVRFAREEQYQYY